MGNIQMTPSTWTYQATGTATNQQPDAPFSNVLDVRPSRFWRTLNLTTMRGTLDAGTPKPFDSAAILYTNGTAAATWRVTATNTLGELFTTPTFDTTHVPLRMSPDLASWHYWHSVLYLGETVTNRYVGIEILDAANPAGYFIVGNVVVGEVFTPDVGFTPDGSGWWWEDTSVEVRLKNSETIYRRAAKKRAGRFVFEYQNDATAHAFDDVERVLGNSTPALVKSDPITANWHQHDMGWGYLHAEEKTWTTRIPPAYWSTSFTVKEV